MLPVNKVADLYKELTGRALDTTCFDEKKAEEMYVTAQEIQLKVEDSLAQDKDFGPYFEDEAEEDPEEPEVTSATPSKITDFFSAPDSRVVATDLAAPDPVRAEDDVLAQFGRDLVKSSKSTDKRTGVKLKLIELQGLLAKLEDYIDNFAEEHFEGEEMVGEDTDKSIGDDDEDLMEEARDLVEYTASINGKRENEESSDDDEELQKKYKRIRR